jgi:hypothetical protein
MYLSPLNSLSRLRPLGGGKGVDDSKDRPCSCHGKVLIEKRGHIAISSCVGIVTGTGCCGGTFEALGRGNWSVENALDA